MKLLKTIGLSILVLLFLSVDLCFGQYFVQTTECWEFIDKGVEYGSLEKFDEAKYEFKKAKEWLEKAMINPYGQAFIEVKNNLRIIEYVDQQKIEPYLAVHYFKTVNKLKKENWYQWDGTISVYDNAVKQTDQAISYYNEVVKQKPEDPTVYFIRAYIYENYNFPYEQMGNGFNVESQYDKAIADYSKAIKLNPEFIDAYLRRGNIYSRKGQYDNAISDYNKLIELKPEDPESYFIRGGAYIGKDEYDNAISDFSKAIELKPDYVDAYGIRGYVYYYKRQYHNAISDFSKAIDLYPTVLYYYLRGNAYAYAGKYEEAIADYIKEEAEYIKPYRGTYSGAYEAIFRELIDIRDDYENRGVQEKRADLYAKTGKYEEAIADYSKAIESNSDNVGIIYIKRGDAYDEMGDLENACSDWKKACSYGIGYCDGWSIINRIRCIGK